MKTIQKICVWCGKPFVGYSNRMYCNYDCAHEYQTMQRQLKEAGKESTKDYVLAHHRETVKEEQRRRLTYKVLKPVHLTSRAVQWRYVDER